MPEGVRYEATTIGGVPAEWARTNVETAGRTLLYFHGGAYCVGSVATHRGLVGRLALAMGADALSLDYRLAPEHPFPAAIDDAVAAYRALVESGVSPSRIVFAGDSAGGGSRSRHCSRSAMPAIACRPPPSASRRGSI